MIQQPLTLRFAGICIQRQTLYGTSFLCLTPHICNQMLNFRTQMGKFNIFYVLIQRYFPTAFQLFDLFHMPATLSFQNFRRENLPQTLYICQYSQQFFNYMVLQMSSSQFSSSVLHTTVVNFFYFYAFVFVSSLVF